MIMKKKIWIRNLILLAVLSCTVGCDQITKTIVRNELSYNENIKFVYNHLTLTKVENSGAFLSLGDSFSSEIRFVFLSLMPLLVLAFGLYFLFSKVHIAKVYAIGLCLVIGGGIGNLYDRLLHGSVTDFLHIDFGLFQTGVFNVADMAIMAGMFIIFLDIYTRKKTSGPLPLPPDEPGEIAKGNGI